MMLFLNMYHLHSIHHIFNYLILFLLLRILFQNLICLRLEDLRRSKFGIWFLWAKTIGERNEILVNHIPKFDLFRFGRPEKIKCWDMILVSKNNWRYDEENVDDKYFKQKRFILTERYIYIVFKLEKPL